MILWSSISIDDDSPFSEGGVSYFDNLYDDLPTILSILIGDSVVSTARDEYFLTIL